MITKPVQTVKRSNDYFYKLHLRRDLLEVPISLQGLEFWTPSHHITWYRIFEFILKREKNETKRNKTKQKTKKQTNKKKTVMNGYTKKRITVSLKPRLSCCRLLQDLRIDEICTQE